MEALGTRARLTSIAPFFIVRDVMAAIAFYRDRLGFELTFLGPDDDPGCVRAHSGSGRAGRRVYVTRGCLAPST